MLCGRVGEWLVATLAPAALSTIAGQRGGSTASAPTKDKGGAIEGDGPHGERKVTHPVEGPPEEERVACAAFTVASGTGNSRARLY